MNRGRFLLSLPLCGGLLGLVGGKRADDWDDGFEGEWDDGGPPVRLPERHELPMAVRLYDPDGKEVTQHFRCYECDGRVAYEAHTPCTVSRIDVRIVDDWFPIFHARSYCLMYGDQLVIDPALL